MMVLGTCYEGSLGNQPQFVKYEFDDANEYYVSTVIIQGAFDRTTF